MTFLMGSTGWPGPQISYSDKGEVEGTRKGAKSIGLLAPDHHGHLTSLRAQTFHNAKAPALGSWSSWILCKVRSFLGAIVGKGAMLNEH